MQKFLAKAKPKVYIEVPNLLFSVILTELLM